MEYLSASLQFLVLIPAAILCYLPMRNRLIYSPLRIAALGGAAYLICVPAATGLFLHFQAGANAVMLPLILLFFFFYRKTLDVPLSKALAVYVLVCALLSFCSLYANGFSAWRHPQGTYLEVYWDTDLFQLACTSFLLLLLWRPFGRQFSSLIDRLDFDRLWLATLPVSGLFLLLNIQCIPRSYETLYVNRVFPIFLLIITLLFSLLLFLCILFYHTVALLMASFEQKERTHFLEIQAEQYNTLHNHIEQTRRLRHDFRHSVHALSVLAESGDIESLKKHLADYEREQDAVLDRIRPFCRDAVLNALFNHYYAMAESTNIRTDWRLSLPEPLAIPVLDLTSLLGNILENAIAGCQTVPEAQRFFSLTIEAQEKDSLYIVSSNSSDGNLKQESGIFRSTCERTDGHGTGLYSIRTLAEKHHGMAQFAYKDGMFCVDVALKLQAPGTSSL